MFLEPDEPNPGIYYEGLIVLEAIGFGIFKVGKVPWDYSTGNWKAYNLARFSWI